VLLADDHRVLREGLRELLRRSGATLVGEASDGAEAVRVATETTHDVVILRHPLPVLSAEEACRRILDARPDTSVLILSVHADRHLVLRMLRAGASGFALETDEFEELYAAARVCAEGGLHFSPGLGESIIRSCREGRPGQPWEGDPLSQREREVLQLVAEGRSTREIAKSLHLSVKTVETHRRRIMHKLDIHNVAQLTKYAVREGLTTLES
jgi:two-component system NarL family response regulator